MAISVTFQGFELVRNRTVSHVLGSAWSGPQRSIGRSTTGLSPTRGVVLDLPLLDALRKLDAKWTGLRSDNKKRSLIEDRKVQVL